MKQILQRSLWSHRDMRLVLAGRTASLAGDAVAMVALMLRVSERAGPAGMTALLLAFAVPLVMMIPFAGRIVDRHDSRTVLVAASLLQAAVAGALATADGLASTVALVCVLQVGQAVALPAWTALMPRIVGEELVGQAVGVSQALAGVAMLAGSALGGVLVGWRGDGIALAVDAVTFTGLAVVAAAIRTRRRPAPRTVDAPVPGGAVAGLRVIFADDLLRVLVPGLWVFILAAEAVNVVEVFLVTDAVGLGPSAYGVVLAFQGAGGIAGAWLAGRIARDVGRTRAVLLGTLGIGASCILMGLAWHAVVLVAGAVGCGLSGGLLNAASGALAVTRSPEAVRGRVMAAVYGTNRACSVAALLLGGLAGWQLGPRGTFVAAGATCVLTSLLVGACLGPSRLRPSADDSVPGRVSH